MPVSSGLIYVDQATATRNLAGLRTSGVGSLTGSGEGYGEGEGEGEREGEGVRRGL